VAELREAICRGEYNKMLALVDQIAAREERLGRRLRQLVERFDYGILQQILATRL